MSVKAEDLDAPIWGAKAIARELNLFTAEKNKKTRKPTGKTVPDERKAFYLLETGAIRANQIRGRDGDGKVKQRGQWVTTLRLIRQSLLPTEAA